MNERYFRNRKGEMLPLSKLVGEKIIGMFITFEETNKVKPSGFWGFLRKKIDVTTRNRRPLGSDIELEILEGDNVRVHLTLTDENMCHFLDIGNLDKSVIQKEYVCGEKRGRHIKYTFPIKRIFNIDWE